MTAGAKGPHLIVMVLIQVHAQASGAGHFASHKSLSTW